MTDTSTAFVFPGGGSQKHGILTEFHDRWPEIEEQLARLDHDDVRRLLLGDGSEPVGNIVNMHKAVVGSGAVVEAAVRDRLGIEPAFVAGHSLGHLTALPAAGMLSLSDAIDLAIERGHAMQHAEETAGPGKMVAVLLVDSATVDDVTAEIDGVRTAVYNAPKQTVISGRTAAVDTACDQLASEATALKQIELDVATASHSPVMEPAVERIETAIASTELREPTTPVASDVTGELYETVPTAIEDLERQIVSPIQWVSVVETLAAQGVEQVVEFPPAGTLSNIIPKIAPEIDVVTLDEPAKIEQVAPARSHSQVI